MTPIAIIIGIVVVAAIMASAIVWSCCRLAGFADERIEKLSRPVHQPPRLICWQCGQHLEGPDSGLPIRTMLCRACYEQRTPPEAKGTFPPVFPGYVFTKPITH